MKCSIELELLLKTRQGCYEEVIELIECMSGMSEKGSDLRATYEEKKEDVENIRLEFHEYSRKIQECVTDTIYKIYKNSEQ